MPFISGMKPAAGIPAMKGCCMFCMPLMAIMGFWNMDMFCKEKPRGVPDVRWWLLGRGKWPLELASDLEGAMWEGSRTYVLTRFSCRLVSNDRKGTNESTYIVLESS